MFDKKEFDEFIGEVSYLNESTKSLIQEIKKADKMSINLKDTLGSLETVSKSLNFQINKALDESISSKIGEIIDKKMRVVADKSQSIKDTSISISQSVDFLNQAARKIEKQRKWHIMESLLYIIFFISGAFTEAMFNILKF